MNKNKKNKINGKGHNKNVKKHKKTLLILLIIVIILLIISLVLFKLVKNKTTKQDNIKKTTTKSTKKDVWKKSNGKNGNIYVYESKDNGYLYVVTDDNKQEVPKDDYNLLNTYKCNMKNCTSYNEYNDIGYVIIKDDTYRLYDYKNNLYKETNIPAGNYSAISLMYYENTVYGYAIQDDKYMNAIYNVKTNKLSEFKYKMVGSINSSAELSKGYVSVSYSEDNTLNLINPDKMYLIRLKDEKKVLESDLDKEYGYEYITSISNGKYVYYVKNVGVNANNSKIYNSDLKELFNGKRYSKYAVSDKGNIVVSEDNNYFIYNNYGELVKKSKTYKEICTILNDYIIVVDNDNYLKITDYDGNVLARFTKMKDNYKFINMASGIYTKNGKHAIFAAIENSDIEEGTIGRGLYYYYVPETKEKGMFEAEIVE